MGSDPRGSRDELCVPWVFPGGGGGGGTLLYCGSSNWKAKGSCDQLCNRRICFVLLRDAGGDVVSVVVLVTLRDYLPIIGYSTFHRIWGY